MLPEALAALASAGGTAVVSAMVGDGWNAAKKRLAQLLGRGDPARIAELEERLGRHRDELAQLAGEELERAQILRAETWRAQLVDLLEESPDTATSLQEWLADIGASPSLSQRVVGHDNAQQATLGIGIQHVTFHSRPNG